MNNESKKEKKWHARQRTVRHKEDKATRHMHINNNNNNNNIQASHDECTHDIIGEAAKNGFSYVSFSECLWKMEERWAKVLFSICGCGHGVVGWHKRNQ